MKKFKAICSTLIVSTLILSVFSIFSTSQVSAFTNETPRIEQKENVLIMPTKIPQIPSEPNYAVQPPPGGGSSSDHYLEKLETKTVYGDPRDQSAENGLAIALVAMLPQLQGYKYVSTIIGLAGVSLAYNSFVDDSKPKNKFTIYYWVYKSKKPTSNYYGYYVIDIYNHDTGKKAYGKGVTIGKTAY